MKHKNITTAPGGQFGFYTKFVGKQSPLMEQNGNCGGSQTV